jgi:hypothetical protein
VGAKDRCDRGHLPILFLDASGGMCGAAVESAFKVGYFDDL